jgi:hypothetical protein
MADTQQQPLPGMARQTFRWLKREKRTMSAAVIKRIAVAQRKRLIRL